LTSQRVIVYNLCKPVVIAFGPPKLALNLLEHKDVAMNKYSLYACDRFCAQ
jgi:hypothetical protein